MKVYTDQPHLVFDSPDFAFQIKPGVIRSTKVSQILKHVVVLCHHAFVAKTPQARHVEPLRFPMGTDKKIKINLVKTHRVRL